MTVVGTVALVSTSASEARASLSLVRLWATQQMRPLSHRSSAHSLVVRTLTMTRTGTDAAPTCVTVAGVTVMLSGVDFLAKDKAETS